MGATVLLYDRYDQLVRRSLTNEQGKFAFDHLTPDLYSIRVTLASFVPALRRNIAVAAGSENLLEISLANLFSSVDIISSGPARGTLLSDDWKWVLRSSQATRPVLRFLPASSDSQSAASTGSMFSDTTGLLKVSAGDGESFLAGTQQDLGTAFAVATSIYGNSRVQLSGNFGYVGNSTIPAAGFRTTYSRGPEGSGPEVTLTVRQLALPSREALSSEPALRTMALAMRDRVDLTDNLRLEYGMSIESVTFIERMTYISPFARATYDLGNGAVRVAYSNGAQPAEFAARRAWLRECDGLNANAASLNNDLNALALLPRISRRDDQVQVQRTQSLELGYERIQGSRKYSASVYSETASNVALMLSGPQGFVPWADSLPDVGTNDRIFNVGSYNRVGYTMAMKQALGDHLDASVAAGHTGSLAVDPQALAGNSGDELRSVIHEVARPWLAMSVSGTMPATGTHLMTSYGVTDSRVLMPDHVYMTQDIMQSTGWNNRIRQPLPLFSGRGRQAGGNRGACAICCAQGYLPLEASGRKALLTNSPRAIRGGQAFIF